MNHSWDYTSEPDKHVDPEYMNYFHLDSPDNPTDQPQQLYQEFPQEYPKPEVSAPTNFHHEYLLSEDGNPAASHFPEEPRQSEEELYFGLGIPQHNQDFSESQAQSAMFSELRHEEEMYHQEPTFGPEFSAGNYSSSPASLNTTDQTDNSKLHSSASVSPAYAGDNEQPAQQFQRNGVPPTPQSLELKSHTPGMAFKSPLLEMAPPSRSSSIRPSLVFTPLISPSVAPMDAGEIPATGSAAGSATGSHGYSGSGRRPHKLVETSASYFSPLTSPALPGMPQQVSPPSDMRPISLTSTANSEEDASFDTDALFALPEAVVPQVGKKPSRKRTSAPQSRISKQTQTKVKYSPLLRPDDGGKDVRGNGRPEGLVSVKPGLEEAVAGRKPAPRIPEQPEVASGTAPVAFATPSTLMNFGQTKSKATQSKASGMSEAVSHQNQSHQSHQNHQLSHQIQQNHQNLHNQPTQPTQPTQQMMHSHIIPPGHLSSGQSTPTLGPVHHTPMHYMEEYNKMMMGPPYLSLAGPGGHQLPRGLSAYGATVMTDNSSKRNSHKLAEQGRRNRMNTALNDLGKLLPDQVLSSSGSGIPSKASTVEKAIEYIKLLKKEISVYREKLEEFDEKGVLVVDKELQQFKKFPEKNEKEGDGKGKDENCEKVEKVGENRPVAEKAGDK